MTEVERVQRVPDEWPLLHLEDALPTWVGLRVDGLVQHPQALDLAVLATLAAETRVVPFHCVWGWSRPHDAWNGIGLDRLLDLVGATGSHVTITSASDAYSACLPVDDARTGMLAWARDDQPLSEEHGGPLRYLPPPTHWAYKGVKWAARITLGDRFVPGFWESKVADPIGRIPPEVTLP